MLELSGVARRVGAAVCTLTLTGLCLGATAPASHADEHGKNSKNAETPATHVAPAAPAAPARKASPAKVAKKAPAAKAKPSSRPASGNAKPRQAQHPQGKPATEAGPAAAPAKTARIQLDDLLLPGALSVAATDPLVRRPSALVVTPLVQPVAPVPETTSSVILTKTKGKAGTGGTAGTQTVSAAALLDVRAFSPTAVRTGIA
ncbi:MAG: hypothetical protein H0V92_05415, partial [Pseudonocardiales bacterium]|nr:hypothetical protein [Pseudonocardiales bacterium]